MISFNLRGGTKWENGLRLLRGPLGRLLSFTGLVFVLVLILKDTTWTRFDSTSYSTYTSDQSQERELMFVQEDLEDHGKTFDRQISLQRLLQDLTKGRNDFDWSDWLDLSATDWFDQRLLNRTAYPNLCNKTLESLNFPLRKKTNPEEMAMTGRLFCKNYMPAPSQILRLRNPAFINPEDVVKPLDRFYMRHSDDKRSHRQYDQSEYRVPEDLPPLLPGLADMSWQDRDGLDIPYSMFEFSPLKLIEELANDTSAGSQAHLELLTAATSRVTNSAKHFNEVELLRDPLGTGNHYDWRFFRGVDIPDRHRKLNQVLMRAWAQFAESEGIPYWISHGSLIGWFWNGISLPWDSDNDVQVPAMELDRLARKYNGTLVVQDPGEGNRKFYIDMSPWYVQRRRGNGRNVIDGRFIDVDTGIYVDITGLARTKFIDKRVNCKNNHRYDLEQLVPLRRTLYEGAPTFVPREVKYLLREEYSSYDKPRFDKWIYNAKAELWDRSVPCGQFLRRYGKKDLVFCRDPEVLEDCDSSTAPFGTCSIPLIELHNRTETIRSLHKQEMAAFVEMDLMGTHGLPKELSTELSQFYPPAM